MGKFYNLANLPADPKFDGNFYLYETQEHLPHEHQAIRRLRRVARIVSPLMRNHGWSDIILCELEPGLPLRGFNMITFPAWKGSKSHSIHVCLRHYNTPEIFLPIEYVVQTIIHELAHIDTPCIHETEEEAHNLDFWVRNVSLLMELEESVDRGEVDKIDVPTRCLRGSESGRVYKLYEATPNDPRIQLILPEVLPIEPDEVRVYSRNTLCKFKMGPKPTWAPPSLLSFLGQPAYLHSCLSSLFQ